MCNNAIERNIERLAQNWRTGPNILTSIYKSNWMKEEMTKKQASHNLICSACEAGDCGVGLWPTWPLWGLRLGCGWLEWEWLKKCLCWHPLAADGRKSQTSSCLLASVKSNCSLLYLWKWCPVIFCLFLVRFTWFCVLLSSFSWHGTLGKHTALIILEISFIIWGFLNHPIFEALLDQH